MEYHELSNIFPMMSDEEFQALKNDIQTNGLRETIWTYEGKIIDGRNRFKACSEVGVEPRFQEWTGPGSLIGFIVSLNLHRRHLNSSQKATCAIEADDIMERLRLEAKERQIATLKQGDIVPDRQLIAQRSEGKATEQAAKLFQTNRQYISDVKVIQESAPEKLIEIKEGKKTIPQVKKEIAADDKKKKRAEMAESAKAVELSSRWNVYQSDIATWAHSKNYDLIITDPPYPKEYLPLWEILAKRSNEWLKDGGLLIAMSGQSYLPVIYEMMSKHLTYYWTAAYLTPGQPKPLRQVNVNTTWKPLLIFRKGKYTGKIFGDVFKSDGNDKSLHDWGQSESGMIDIISKMCLPGQVILDPFCGAGTTGVAALKHGCFFDGLDSDIESVNIAKARLNDTKV